MIIIGLASIAFFMNALLNKDVIGFKPLYVLLLLTFIFAFIKIIFEWYHYWSISIPVTPPVTKQYTVDVFTTFCAGEPYEMILETLNAIQAITYPHETYLCDEANDPYLRSVCEKLGIHHITRTDKINAKAGNINNALRQSSGELCLILDPDHIPVPEFFDAIISHFDNPEIGYVQIVQAYYNQHTSWIAKGAAQQTYQFYGPMMMCMNSYNTVQAIGANCTFRRSALESIGGYAPGLAEDMHTSMQLQARQWKSVYVPKILTQGLVPATLSAYYKQQLKWSRGVFELFVTTYFKLFKKFTWRQKLHYSLLPLFYLSGFIFLINFLVPAISLVTDLFPLQMDFLAFVVVSTPFITSVILIRHYAQRWVMKNNEEGFHVIGGLLFIGTWWIFILGVIYTFIRKDVPYIPTPKEIKDEKNFKINLPNVIVLLISITAIIYGLINDWNPYTIFMAGFVGLNCLFMVFMLIASSELKFRAGLTYHSYLNQTIKHVKNAKGRFWLFRRQVYAIIRPVSLLLSAFALCFTIYISTKPSEDRDLTTSSYLNHLKWGKTNDKKPLVGMNQKDTAGLFAIVEEHKVWEKEDKTVVSSKDSLNSYASLIPQPTYTLATKGVIYTKGSYWYKNIRPLTKKDIISDFGEMKLAGINEVKIYGPNIYDGSIFYAAEQHNLNISYSFWIPGPADFIHNTDNLKSLKKSILKTVRKNKNNEVITNWNLGNSTLQQLTNYYSAPQLYYAQNNFIKWLKRVVNEIKQIDSHRKITVDVTASSTLNLTANLLHKQIPAIDAFGLVIHDSKAFQNITDKLNVPYFFSSLDPAVLKDGGTPPAGGVFYAHWQDQEAASIVTFDGLKDVYGRNKPSLNQISEKWHGAIPANSLPPVKILKPALTPLAHRGLTYNALVYLNNKWNLAYNTKTELTFEWYLIKTDTLGNGFAMTLLGTGPFINVTMPQNIYTHRLYLIAVRGNNVTSDISTLNIPLK
ncbi:glycosyltransferase family 2 protein [Mucilaginibacter boryungensis]|nr:cellulose synthase catalytic subunit [Mucilaginibacter boryungensis]